MLLGYTTDEMRPSVADPRNGVLGLFSLLPTNISFTEFERWVGLARRHLVQAGVGRRTRPWAAWARGVSAPSMLLSMAVQCRLLVWRRRSKDET